MNLFGHLINKSWLTVENRLYFNLEKQSGFEAEKTRLPQTDCNSIYGWQYLN